MNLRKLKRKQKKPSAKKDQDATLKLLAMANDHKAQGRLDQAITSYRRVLQADPNNVEALNNLGNTLHTLKRLDEALSCYKTCCKLLPFNAQIHYNYGTALYEAGRSREAIRELEQTIEIEPNHAEAYASLGVACQSRGDLDRAYASLKRALQINPDYQEARRFLGLVLKDRGDMSGAKQTFVQILRHNPKDAFSRYLLSRYTKYTSEKEAEIPAILSQLDSPETSHDDAVFLYFSLGKIYDDLKQYRAAFHHFSLANQKKRATFGKSVISPGIDVKRMGRIFTPELFKRYCDHGSQSELPVFIVGMPRSGTTLVEQICASHSQVHGAGELKEIKRVKEALAKGDKGLKKDDVYPDCLQTLNPALLDDIAENYIERLGKGLSADIIRVTDKMPTNFIDLGLIRLLFPKARILHIMRDPLDTCLSNFFQNFEEGNECSFELSELGYYFCMYRELMSFWQETLPGEILEVRYEDLVENVESESKRIIDYLGLDWQESCLSFFKTKRMVHTSSDWQVRQPIYNKSVQRWKNYEQFLGPLRKALGDYVEI